MLLSLLAGPFVAQSSDPPPLGSGDPPWLDSWSFSDTNNWLSWRSNAPISFTNLAVSRLGKGNAVVLDSPDDAWLQYRIKESDGATNLALSLGTLLFWFAPNWTSTNLGGAGPQDWSPLLSVGSYTTNASYGWWSLYVDPDGANLYFSSQTNNGTEATYIAAPIAWQTGRWHLIALTYSSTNCALYLDGAVLTNGPGVSCWPGPDVLTNGFFIGSDGSGKGQAHGMFDDMETYNYQVAPDTIAEIFSYDSMIYYGCPMNVANFSSAPSVPTCAPTFVAISGSGFLSPLGTNTSGCLTSSRVWLTNAFTTSSNGAMNLTFTIAGGSNGVPYDVFVNSLMGWTNVALYPWGWMGQGYRCVTYTLTNLKSTAVFLRLGSPQDTDGDGLTDAFERLVSSTNPAVRDSDGDGLDDSFEWLQAMNPNLNEMAAQDKWRRYEYDACGRVTKCYATASATVSLDKEGNITQITP